MRHHPSQVSVETALAHHGLIPEAVHQVVSVTDLRSRTFLTPLGRFVFERVPCDALRAGVRATRVGRDAWAFVSTPLRASADLVYLRRRVTWDRDGLRSLLESMRIEREDLETNQAGAGAAGRGRRRAAAPRSHGASGNRWRRRPRARDRRWEPGDD